MKNFGLKEFIKYLRNYNFNNLYIIYGELKTKININKKLNVKIVKKELQILINKHKEYFRYIPDCFYLDFEDSNNQSNYFRIKFGLSENRFELINFNYLYYYKDYIIASSIATQGQGLFKKTSIYKFKNDGYCFLEDEVYLIDEAIKIIDNLVFL